MQITLFQCIDNKPESPCGESGVISYDIIDCIITGPFQWLLENSTLSLILTLSLHLSLGLSSSLWDIPGRADQQRQPSSSQPVSHHNNSRQFGHPLLGCGCPCVHLPSVLAQPGLQHCGWIHFNLHTGYQLHAVCASGNENTLRLIKDLTNKTKKHIYFLSKASIASFGGMCRITSICLGHTADIFLVMTMLLQYI